MKKKMNLFNLKKVVGSRNSTKELHEIEWVGLFGCEICVGIWFVLNLLCGWRMLVYRGRVVGEGGRGSKRPNAIDVANWFLIKNDRWFDGLLTHGPAAVHLMRNACCPPCQTNWKLKLPYAFTWTHWNRCEYSKIASPDFWRRWCWNSNFR